MVQPTASSNFTSSVSVFTNKIFCAKRLLKRTQISGPITIRKSKDVFIFSAKLQAQVAHPAAQPRCTIVLQDVPDVFRAVAGLATRVDEEQMHHPLLLPLLWGHIGWG